MLRQDAAQFAIRNAGADADGKIARFVFENLVQRRGGDGDIGRRDGAAHPFLGGISEQRDPLLSRARLGQTLREFLGAARNDGHELAIVSAAFASARIDLR